MGRFGIPEFLFLAFLTLNAASPVRGQSDEVFVHGSFVNTGIWAISLLDDEPRVFLHLEDPQGVPIRQWFIGDLDVSPSGDLLVAILRGTDPGVYEIDFSRRRLSAVAPIQGDVAGRSLAMAIGEDDRFYFIDKGTGNLLVLEQTGLFRTIGSPGAGLAGLDFASGSLFTVRSSSNFEHPWELLRLDPHTGEVLETSELIPSLADLVRLLPPEAHAFPISSITIKNFDFDNRGGLWLLMVYGQHVPISPPPHRAFLVRMDASRRFPREVIETDFSSLRSVAIPPSASLRGPSPDVPTLGSAALAALAVLLAGLGLRTLSLSRRPRGP